MEVAAGGDGVDFDCGGVVCGVEFDGCDAVAGEVDCVDVAEEASCEENSDCHWLAAYDGFRGGWCRWR